MLGLVGLYARPVFAQVENSPEAKGLLTSQVSTARHLVDVILEYLIKYGFQVFGGMIVLSVGWILSGFVARFVRRFLESKSIDITITKFIVGAVKLLVMVFAVIVALGKFGIEIAPFIAGLSVVGFGTSFALQGPLSNYAAGATLIFTKPFKVGDIIEVAGQVGEVEDMTLPRTLLHTVDGTRIIIPNKHIIGEIIHNYSEFKKLDLAVGIAYDVDVDKAITLVHKIISADRRVATIRPPRVGIVQFADSSINLDARLWCKQSEYWNLLYDLNKEILEEFRRQNITIPFPQRDVHLYPQEPQRAGTPRQSK